MKCPVLLVDSRASERRRTAESLSQEDFHVVPVSAPQEALALRGAAAMRLAVVELDSFAPEISDDAAGFKARWPHIGMVDLASAARGKTDTEVLAAPRSIGAHAFYVHPLPPAELARRLSELTRQGYGLPERRRAALVVDDSETTGEIMRAFLEKNGFAAVVKPTWEAVLSGRDTLGVDLVFTDIFLPGMGGVEGIRHVRAKWAPVTIVAFSEGLDGRMESDRALLAARKIGADAILPKPFDEANVTAAIRGVFAPRDRRFSA